jgi:hypothetical protein
MDANTREYRLSLLRNWHVIGRLPRTCVRGWCLSLLRNWGQMKSRARFRGAKRMAGRTVAKAMAGDSLGCKSEETESTEIQSRNATTGVMVRTGTEMTEAHHDNAMHRKFVLQFYASRAIYSCASPSRVSNPPIPFGHHVCNIQQMAMHNPCIHLDGHDRTCQNPGDKLSSAR